MARLSPGCRKVFNLCKTLGLTYVGAMMLSIRTFRFFLFCLCVDICHISSRDIFRKEVGLKLVARDLDINKLEHFGTKINNKSCLQETLNLSTCADRSTNTKTDRKGQNKNIFLFHVSGVRCHMCHMSPVTCHLSPCQLPHNAQ